MIALCWLNNKIKYVKLWFGNTNLTTISKIAISEVISFEWISEVILNNTFNRKIAKEYINYVFNYKLLKFKKMEK